MNLTKLKEVCDKASPQPWLYSGDKEILFTYPKHEDNGTILDVDICVNSVDNAEFIAQARTALPILIEVVEKQREALQFYDDVERMLLNTEFASVVENYNNMASIVINKCAELLKELE